MSERDSHAEHNAQLANVTKCKDELAPFTRHPDAPHHALQDALWTKRCWYFLQGMKVARR